MSTLKVFPWLCAVVCLAACSLPAEVNEVFLLHGSRVSFDELDADKLDAGAPDIAEVHEPIVDAGETIDADMIDAGDANELGVDTGSIECSGACLPEIAGWSGPLLVAIGNPLALPPCPNGYDANELGVLDPIASPAACSPCSCSASSGAQCTPRATASPVGIASNQCATILAGGSTGQSAGAYPAGGFTNGTCESFSFAGDPFVVRALWSNAANGVWLGTQGSCAPVGGRATVDPYVWDKHARACSPLNATAGACKTGETCGSVEPGFSSCIVRDGWHECPIGLERREVYRAALDSRACSSCTCSAPNGESCSWTFEVFEGSSCQGSPVASLDVGYGLPASCATIAPASVVRSVLAHEKPSLPGTCDPAGGEPIGYVLPRDPVTICCLH